MQGTFAPSPDLNTVRANHDIGAHCPNPALLAPASSLWPAHRFTPPTHALLAFHRALLEFEAEGGVAGRGARYQKNREASEEGLGFRV